MEPLDGELVLDKRTYDGFAGTGLAETLHGRGTGWVAVAGLTSDCCVLETAGSAFTPGFRTLVVADATASHDRAAPTTRPCGCWPSTARWSWTSPRSRTCCSTP